MNKTFFKELTQGQRFRIQVFRFLLVPSMSSVLYELRLDGLVYEVGGFEPVDEKFAPDLIVYIVK